MNALLQVLGSPTTLVRAYSDRTFADKFLTEGYVRLWKLQHYRSLEDEARRDNSEGEARLKVPALVTVVTIDKNTMEQVGNRKEPGHLNYSMTFQNPTYLLCLSDVSVDRERLMERFGKDVVEVFDPQVLFKRLHAAALALAISDRSVTDVDCFPVRYDKDGMAPEPAYDAWYFRIAYGQKPPEFAWEREYRCAVVLSGPAAGAPELLELRLGETSTFARMHNPETPTAA